MKGHICPYLRSRDDPNTALNFPSEGNHCYRVHPTAAVNRTYQEGYCLSGKHTACPVYINDSNINPLHAPYAPPPARKLPIRALLLLVLLIAVLLAGGIQQVVTSAWFAHLRAPAVGDHGSSQASFSSLFDIPVWSGANTPFAPVTSTPKPDPLPILLGDCPIPAGWVPHVIQPTDSLFRLSVLYSVSLNDLQMANCLSTSAQLQPGDIIYVPAAPNPPATLAPTTRVIVVQPPAVDEDNNEPAEFQPSFTPVPTSTVPAIVNPTQVRPTQVPPTQAPPAQKPPAQAPPAQPPKNPPPVQSNAPGNNGKVDKPAKDDKDKGKGGNGNKGGKDDKGGNGGKGGKGGKP